MNTTETIAEPVSYEEPPPPHPNAALSATAAAPAPNADQPPSFDTVVDIKRDPSRKTTGEEGVVSDLDIGASMNLDKNETSEIGEGQNTYDAPLPAAEADVVPSAPDNGMTNEG